MYICKECGTKYTKKVEYCDCGNNTFDYVEGKKNVVPKQKSTKQPLTLEQKSEYLSRLFLIFCIILSAIVWVIPVKVQQEVKKTAQITVEPVKNIPLIDKIWDDTPVYVEPQQEDVVVNQTPIVLNAIPDYAKPIFKEQKANSSSNINKQQKQVVQSNLSNKQVNQRIEQKSQTPKKIETKQVQEQPKTVQSKTQSVSNINNLQTAKTIEQPKQQQVKVEQPKPAYNPNSPNMLKYKGGLRAAMFSKFAVGSISGSGSCSVKFSVDPTGKLVNRGFVKQSDNKSLNDAVYYMMMSVPKYSPPPSEYHGETIQMNLKINNGDYEISIY